MKNKHWDKMFAYQKLKDYNTAFDVTMDRRLLKAGFKYYDDWTAGPMCGFSRPYGHYFMKLAKHDRGYYILVGHRYSGEDEAINIGSSNSAKNIISLRDALTNLW